MKIKTAKTKELKKRLKYLQSTDRETNPEASHIKGQLRLRITEHKVKE